MRQCFDRGTGAGGKTRLVLVAKSLLIREALRSRFDKCSDLEVVAEVTDPAEAVVWIQRVHPDIILLQASMAKDEIGAMREMVSLGPEARVMVMTPEIIPWHVALRLIRAGAQGLIFSSVGSEDVVKAIRRMSTGKMYLPNELERIFAERHLLGYDGLPEELLTEREFQVMTRLAQGQTNREIARELFISVKTVDTHRASLLRKLGLRNNSDLTRFDDGSRSGIDAVPAFCFRCRFGPSPFDQRVNEGNEAGAENAARTDTTKGEDPMQKITPFLWFDNQAEEAANFYTSIFKNSRIVTVSRYSEVGPGPAGSAMTVVFELEGQRFIALNGGPHFKFTEAISLVVDCETQEELDGYWEKLTADGGKEVQCGWLKDKYGLSWQIVPKILGELAADPQKSGKVMAAVMKMKKLDIEGLKQAAQG